MKIVHTSDIHLASALTSRLPSSKIASRRRELMGNFSSLCEWAINEGASAVIIAGDLFDSEKITRRELDSVLNIIERASKITFFYLPGNHEHQLVKSSGEKLPENLFIFESEWTYYRLGDVTIAGRSETSPDMFSSLMLREDDKNIVVLHGELRDKCDIGGIIGINDARYKPINYMALGHYHKYSEYTLGNKGYAVYSGTPEGRGFDEAFETGFSLVNIDDYSVTHKFVPFGKRRLFIKDVDITGASRSFDIEERIISSISDISPNDLVRVNFVGARELELRFDKDLTEDKFKNKFYYFEIKDNSRLTTRAEDYMLDKSLKGEFIRLCLADSTLSDDEKGKIIHCGLSALAGEAFDT